jgi:hypothetical protein
MPTFRITESAPAAYYWYYEVVAETQEEAERMVEDGEVDPYDTEYEVSNDDTSIIESHEVRK